MSALEFQTEIGRFVGSNENNMCTVSTFLFCIMFISLINKENGDEIANSTFGLAVMTPLRAYLVSSRSREDEEILLRAIKLALHLHDGPHYLEAVFDAFFRRDIVPNTNRGLFASVLQVSCTVPMVAAAGVTCRFGLHTFSFR